METVDAPLKSLTAHETPAAWASCSCFASLGDDTLTVAEVLFTNALPVGETSVTVPPVGATVSTVMPALTTDDGFHSASRKTACSVCEPSPAKVKLDAAPVNATNDDGVPSLSAHS